VKFPLDVGHFFGLNPFDVRCHTGEDNWVDEARIKAWQRAYCLKVDRDQPVTGRFDGPTQRAVVRLQRSKGLPMTAVLDEDTWRALFEVPNATLSHAHDVAPTGVPLAQKDAPEGVSGASNLGTGVEVVAAVVSEEAPDSNRTPSETDETLPQAPDWFNSSSPVGMTSRGPIVRKIRSLLGMQVRETWSQDVSHKIRGLQKMHGLPVTGWVDTRTAVILDSLSAKR
jgi:hypothetical protein